MKAKQETFKGKKNELKAQPSALKLNFKNALFNGLFTHAILCLAVDILWYVLN